MYNSAPYLPDYLDSLANLEGGHADLEVLFIDDGSPDDSETIIRDWMSSHRISAHMIRKEHGGSVTARNAGLDAASGTWVSFPDPDDLLRPGYLAAVRAFLSEVDDAKRVSAMATKVLQFTTEPRDASDTHVLGFRYHEGRRCVHLNREPRYFHTHAPSGFYRLEEIQKRHLRLDPRLGAAFEDAGFVAEYLLGFDDPTVALVPDAEYVYRRRTDSVLGSMWSKAERYTSVLEHGYLRVLGLRKPAPVWLQYLVLYDLFWCFHEYDIPDTPNRAVGRDVSDTFLRHLDDILELVDEEAIYGFPMHPVPLHIRTALAACKTRRILRPEGRITDVDEGSRTARISYFRLPGTFPAEDEVITLDGFVRQPLEQAERPIEFYGRTFLIERELVLDVSGSLMIRVGGEVLPLTADRDGLGSLAPWHLDRLRRS